jgi:hypothetical protein
MDCPICLDHNVRENPLEGVDGVFKLRCRRCGEFTVKSSFIAERPRQLTDDDVGKISGWIFEHSDRVLDGSDWGPLLGIKPLSVGAKAEKLLLYLGRKYPNPNQPIEFSGSGEELAASYSVNGDEARYIFNKYLGNYKSFIAFPDRGGLPTTISPAGWDYLYSLQSINKESQIGFCAMWFHPEMRCLWDAGIEPGIKLAGYDPIRIDRVEHNNRIDDEIIATIRRSKFVVADFTGGRGGVYFEAGFALGINIPVIWTVREDKLKSVHFDNRQYSFITWVPDNLEEFQVRLKNRIEATIGNGPVLP